MNQNDWPALTFDHEVESSVVNRNEFREGLRMMMRNAGCEVRSSESPGSTHKKNLSGQGAKGNPQITPIKRRQAGEVYSSGLNNDLVSSLWSEIYPLLEGARLNKHHRLAINIGS